MSTFPFLSARFSLTSFSIILLFASSLFSCSDNEPIDLRIKEFTAPESSKIAKQIESTVNPTIADGLQISLWGMDSLVADPIAIDIDNQGRIYYTRTNRQKHSEFDIRGHREWETASVALQSVEDKRAFLHDILSPEKSAENQWLEDLNEDGSHDWRDMLIEQENIYRIEDISGDGVADRSQLVVKDFNTEVTDVAGAVLINGEDLFVGVGPDLWRIKDKNKDGIADDKSSIAHGFGVHVGFGGHGMSGLEMGPDGKIYWGIGDIGFHGKGSDPEGETFKYPNRGVIVRSNPDGTDFEVFAMGLRNTHEFVFDEYGNLISQDNDGDHAGESERLVYVTNGSDTGWRINWQLGKYRDKNNNSYKVWMDEEMYKPRNENQAAYFTPCIANFVNGPTGFVYNPGTALSDKWKNHFFVSEFVGNPSQAGIHSFKLIPKGATFSLGEHQQVVKGVLATGLDFGPDGALYVADWIDGWETKDIGRIWKLDDPDGKENDDRKMTQRLLLEEFKHKTADELSEILKNPDMRVRQKAQFELVSRGEAGAAVFSSTLEDRSNQLARVHAIWGTAQLARKDMNFVDPLIPLLNDEDPEIRAQAAKWLGDIRYTDAGKLLIPLLSDENPRTRFFAAEALGRISFSDAFEPIIQMLEANNEEDAYLRHAGSLALARIGNAAPLIALKDHSSRAVKIAAVVALRRMEHEGIKEFLIDEDEYIVAEAARGINDDWSIVSALPDLGNLLKSTKFESEPLIRRAINANLRVGTTAAMNNLLFYVQENDAPVAMRKEAIDALATWNNPSVFDRVDGRHRGVIERDDKEAIALAAPVLTALLQNKEESIRLSTTIALGKLGVKESGNQLYQTLANDPSELVRAAAVESLALLSYQQLDDAIGLALKDTGKPVRVAALNLLDKTEMDPSLMVPMLTEVIQKQSVNEKQSALVMLGKMDKEVTAKTFNSLLDQFESNDFPQEILLELSEALEGNETLLTRFTEIQTNRGIALEADYTDALYGGNSENGRSIVFQHQTAQCMRCHSWHDYGGSAGPQLNGVASRLSREQLLEALVNPSAKIADGYGMVILQLNNNTKIAGTVVEQNTTSLTLRKVGQPDTLIMVSDIASQTLAPSSMPDMKNLLSKREIRDLVTFLSGLNEE